MNYFKFTPYIYLIAGIYFAYSGITKLNSGTDMSYLSFILAAMSIGMFFFRRKFAKKYDNRNNNQ
jgi:hypothetical protein